MTEKDYYYPSQSTATNGMEQTIVKTQAVFVNKLYKMLEDTSIQHLICWSENGDLFSVSNPSSFSKIVLPQYFKHNNWQSFVRQLNMYGFHKVNDMIHSNLTSDNQTWEFKHPYFKRGEIDDLQYIKRKSARPSTNNNDTNATPMKTSRSTPISYENMNPMDKHISHIEGQLHHVSKSCELLRNESDFLRGVLSQQQKAIHEFATIFTDLIQEDALIDLDQTKKETLLTKLTNLLSFQHYENQYDYSSLWSTTSSSSSSSIASSSFSPTNIPTNRLLGFGKESHLLNPEPFTDNNKKRRID